jgi:hypothetical protein
MFYYQVWMKLVKQVVFVLLIWGLVASSAIAETRQMSYTISSGSETDFSGLMQRAEQFAHDWIQQSFVSNPSLTDVTVHILGEHNGAEAPLLYVTVSRAQWQHNPTIATWGDYFGRASAVVLGYTSPHSSSLTATGPTNSTSLSTASLLQTVSY